LGKTTIASWIVLWAVLVFDDCKVPTTASAWRQLTKYLWPEIHKWGVRLRWDKIHRKPFDPRTELMTLSIKRGASCEAFALASDRAELIEGAHAEHLIYVFDEAKTIGEETWDAAEGAFASGDCYALAISTPGEPQGRFYDIHRHATGYEDWWTRHVTLEEAIKSGRVNRDWAEKRKRQWGETSAAYQNRVMGEFASSEEDGVIPLAWVEAANARWLKWADAGKVLEPPMTAVGVDVARSGSDKTTMAPRYDNIITTVKVWSGKDTMYTVGRVHEVLKKYGGMAVVDVIGLGAGVYDRLREMKDEVLAFNAGERTNVKDKAEVLGFVDKRSASWWMLRELLDPDGGELIALPPDAELKMAMGKVKQEELSLTGELTAPHWTETSNGRIRVESKKQIKKRLKRSTDLADAIIMALVGPDLIEQYGGSVDVLEMAW